MMKKKLLLVGILLYIPFFSFTQAPPPPYDPCDPETYVEEECDPVETPLDDGVVLLISAGALFGLKSIRPRKHK